MEVARTGFTAIYKGSVERGSHCVNLSAHVLSFCIPGSAFAALTAAGLTTNLPLAGQAIR
jgi:hypothetical protein